jgi:hypothetical protein
MLLDRRIFLHAGGASALSFLTGHRTCALGDEGHLLDQQRIANYRLPALSSVDCCSTSTAGVMIEAGYRLLVFHRPGYAGTALSGRAGGRRHDWRTAADQAELAAGLLDYSTAAVSGTGR